MGSTDSQHKGRATVGVQINNNSMRRIKCKRQSVVTVGFDYNTQGIALCYLCVRLCRPVNRSFDLLAGNTRRHVHVHVVLCSSSTLMSCYNCTSVLYSTNSSRVHVYRWENTVNGSPHVARCPRVQVFTHIGLWSQEGSQYVVRRWMNIFCTGVLVRCTGVVLAIRHHKYAYKYSRRKCKRDTTILICTGASTPLKYEYQYSRY